MTLESKLFDALKAVCPRVFPDVAPVSTARPYVTYQQIGGQVVDFIDNTVASKENAEVQVNVWDDTRAGASALVRQIEAAMIAATTFQARPLAAPVSDHDSDMQRYGARQDFTVWSDR